MSCELVDLGEEWTPRGKRTAWTEINLTSRWGIHKNHPSEPTMVYYWI